MKFVNSLLILASELNRWFARVQVTRNFASFCQCRSKNYWVVYEFFSVLGSELPERFPILFSVAIEITRLSANSFRCWSQNYQVI